MSTLKTPIMGRGAFLYTQLSSYTKKSNFIVIFFKNWRLISKGPIGKPISQLIHQNAKGQLPKLLYLIQKSDQV